MKYSDGCLVKFVERYLEIGVRKINNHICNKKCLSNNVFDLILKLSAANIICGAMKND